MNNQQQAPPPGLVGLGDQIEHDLMPGYLMTVWEARPCEPHPAFQEPHDMYRVTDPSGHMDWLCGYDVRSVT